MLTLYSGLCLRKIDYVCKIKNSFKIVGFMPRQDRS